MSINRSTMRTMIQRRIADTTATTFYETAFYNDIIDSRTLSRAGMVDRYSPNYYMVQNTITGVDDATDSTNEFYQVPSDFRVFVSLERRYGTGLGTQYLKLRVINPEDQERYRLTSRVLLTLPDSITNYEQVVSLWNNRVRIVPAPVNNGYIYRLRYLRRPIAASADESNLDIPDEWGETVALDCAIFILTRTGDPVADRLKVLRDEEIHLLSQEYRRRIMDVNPFPTMDQM